MQSKPAAAALACHDAAKKIQQALDLLDDALMQNHASGILDKARLLEVDHTLWEIITSCPVSFFPPARLSELDRQLSDLICSMLPNPDPKIKLHTPVTEMTVPLTRIQSRIKTLQAAKTPEVFKLDKWSGCLAYYIDQVIRGMKDFKEKSHGSNQKNKEVSKEQKKCIKIIEDVWEMEDFLERSLAEAYLANRTGMEKDRLLEDLKNLSGMSSYQFNLLQPTLNFAAFLLQSRNPSSVLGFFEHIVAAELQLDMNFSASVRKLALVSSISRKYNQAAAEKENKQFVIESLLKKSEKLLHVASKGGPLDERMELLKLCLAAVQPVGSSLDNKLSGLCYVVTADYRELIKVKQSLNLSDPKDVLYDILLDLIRLNQSSSYATTGCAASNQQPAPNQHLPPISIPLLHHKLSSQLIQSVLTPAYLFSVKPLFPKNCPPFTLLAFSVLVNSQDQGALKVVLESVNHWVQGIRNIVKTKNIEAAKEEARLLLSIVKLEKILEIASNDKLKKKAAKCEDLNIVIKACARVCYTGFYIFRLIEDDQRATLMLEKLFELGQDIPALWSVQRDSGNFFLDMLTLVIDIKKSESEAKRDDAQLISSLINFLCIISAYSSQDSEEIKCYKSLVLHSVALNFPDKMSSLPRPTHSLAALLSVNSPIPRDSLLHCLKSSIGNPSVYYQYFMNISLDTIEENYDAVLKLVVNIYEDFKLSCGAAKRHGEHDISFCVLSIKYLDLLFAARPRVDFSEMREVFSRVSKYLYNLFVDRKEFDTLKASMIYLLLSHQQCEELKRQPDNPKKTLIPDDCMRLISSLDINSLVTSKITISFAVELCKQYEQPMDESALASELLGWIRKYQSTRLEQEKIRPEDLPQELDDLLLDIELTSLPEKTYLYLEFSLMYLRDKEEALNWITQIVNNSTGASSVTSPDSLLALFAAAKRFNNAQLSCQLMRVQLRSLLSSSRMDLPAIYSLYCSLLGTCDTTRDLKMYLNQLSEVMEMPVSDPNSLEPQIHRLVSTLARLLEDYGSLRENILPLAKKLDDKYAQMIRSNKKSEYMMVSIKRSSN